MWGAHAIDFVHKMQRRSSQRQLVRAALAVRRLGLRDGSYPVDRPAIEELSRPDPFVGSRIGFRPSPDGGLHLDIAGARELAAALLGQDDGETFTVRLPPLQATAS